MVDIYFLADKNNLNWCYCCHKQANCKESHLDTSSTLQRLCIMLTDPEARCLISRHILLINHYLGLADHQFLIIDVPYLSIVLEHLCREVCIEPLYANPLLSLLYNIQKPPSIFLSSQSEQYQSAITDYINSLCKCYASLNKHEFRFLVISAINNTMFASRNNEHLVNQHYCVKALENSQLPQIFSSVLEAEANTKDIGNILDLLLHLTMVSDQICLSFYQEEYVERLLNLSSLFLNDSEHHIELHRIGLLLIKILSTIMSTENYSQTVISQNSLRNLRTWFQSRVIGGEKRKRNMVTSVILALVRTQRNLNLASCNLLEDIILLSVSPKCTRERTWTRAFELTGDPADFHFKKMLLVALYELLDYFPTKIVCERLGGVFGLSHLLDLKLWSDIENNLLLMYSLHLVPRIATCLHSEVIKYDLLSKMILRSGKLDQSSDCDEVFFHLVQSIYSLTLNSNLTEYFKEKNIVPSLLDYCETILKMTSWSVKIQLVLQYMLNSIVNIVSKLSIINNKCLRLCHPDSLTSDLMRRYISPFENDSIFDPCLKIAIVDFVWVIQTKEAARKIEFLKSGGLYLIMDALEKEVKKSVEGVTVLLLALLSDMLQEDLAVTQAVMWKGSKYTHLISMLCDIWRAAERNKQVQRNIDCIKDCEAPLMGYVQGSIKCNNPASCPPLLEMMGCVRPKIFSILSQLLKDHKQLVTMTEDTYSALFRKMTFQDRVTLELIKYYEFLKEGEIWQNMLCSLKKNGTPPVAGDELMLHTLILKHITCARNIQQVQIKLLKKQLNKELKEEENLYNKIRLSKLVDDMDKYRELEKNLIIENNALRMSMKHIQLSQIEEATYAEWKKKGFFSTHNQKKSSTLISIGRNIIIAGRRQGSEV